MSIPDGGPAFPHRDNIFVKSPQGDWSEKVGEKQWPGVTIRDYFAGKALPIALHYFYNQVNPELLAHEAYGIADAMLKEREK